MDRRLSRWLVLFLLAWLPVQAVAVPLLALCCPDAAHAAAAMHDCHEPSPVVEDTRAPGESDHALNPGHFCCPHFSAVPPTAFALSAEPVPFQAPVPVERAYSFFPEQPQRPPRT